MKHLLLNSLAIAIGLTTVSCAKNEVQDSLSDKISVKTSFLGRTRTEDEAIVIARNAIGEFFQKGKSAIGLECSNPKVFCPSFSSKSGMQRDSLIYVVNFDNGGFAVIAADRGEEPLICVTEKGFYDGTPTEVEGFNMYMEETIARLSSAPQRQLTSGFDDIEIITVDTVEVQNEFIDKIIDIHWHQHAPFNGFCFNYDIQGPAGCAPIAAAQSMAYYSYPDSLDIHFYGESSFKTELNWSQMKSHTTNHDNDCPYCIQNALLVREIGYRMGTIYNSTPGQSGTLLMDIQPGLFSLGYISDYSDDFDISKIAESIQLYRPVIITGHSNTQGWHTWNIFGYKRNYRHILIYTSTLSRPRPRYAGEEIQDNRYVYMNYGKGGNSDGWYLAYQYFYAQGIRVYNGGVEEHETTIFNGDFNQNVFTLNNIRINNQSL